jgi:transposase
MFGLNDGMRYYVCQRYVRMNLGINGLYRLVSQEMDLPPLSGAVFIFFSKNRQQVKLLRWDTDGFTLYQKRLERGTFEIPYSNTGKKACVMPYKTLSAIMDGISLRSVRYRKRLNIDSSVLVISLSRRNSLFFGSHAGARRAAMFYSLACSCRLQGVNFFE